MGFIDPIRITPTKITPPTPKPVNADTGFNPAMNGFAFDNKFDNNVFAVMSAWTGLPMPDIGVIKTGGLCGGMCYAALDYFLTGVPLPRAVTSKPRPSTLPNEYALWYHLVKRQGDSTPYVASKITTAWLKPWFIESAEDEFRDGLTAQLNLVIAELRRGRPMPIGLMNNNFTLTGNHQVLAYRVAQTNDTDPRTARIFVYDPNQPNTIAILTAIPGQNKFMMTGDGTTWRTFFADTTYRIHNPPRLAPNLGQTAGNPPNGRVIARPTVNPPEPKPAAGGIVGRPGVLGPTNPNPSAGGIPATRSGIFGQPYKPIK